MLDFLLSGFFFFCPQVLFNVSITMKECSTTAKRKYVMLKPIGFNESTRVNIHTRCACQKEDSLKHKRILADEMSLDSEASSCKGSICHSDNELSSEQCKMQKDHPVCNRQGNCVNGKCICYKTKLGRVYGKYCEKDDFSCPYHLGTMCAGKL